MAERVTFEIVGGPEFTRVANALREVDHTLPRKLRKDMKNKIKPLVRRAQMKVRAMPVEGNSHKHTGLRRRVARGVRLRIGTGNSPYFRVVTVMAATDEATIPRGLDDPVHGWHHPTFGHAPTVLERPIGGHWFVETFADGRGEIRDGLRDVLEEAAQFVADAGGRI